MTDTTKDARKTGQALKISATWTPSEAVNDPKARAAFGIPSPLRFEGGRMRVVCAIGLDTRVPATVLAASERAAQIEKALAAAGTIHTFSTEVGRVPLDQITEAVPTSAAAE